MTRATKNRILLKAHIWTAAFSICLLFVLNVSTPRVPSGMEGKMSIESKAGSMEQHTTKQLTSWKKTK